MFMCIGTCVYVCMCVCACVHVCMCVCVQVCKCACVHVCMYVCVHVCHISILLLVVVLHYTHYAYTIKYPEYPWYSPVSCSRCNGQCTNMSLQRRTTKVGRSTGYGDEDESRREALCDVLYVQTGRHGMPQAAQRVRPTLR